MCSLGRPHRSGWSCINTSHFASTDRPQPATKGLTSASKMDEQTRPDNPLSHIDAQNEWRTKPQPTRTDVTAEWGHHPWVPPSRLSRPEAIPVENPPSS